MSSKTVSFFSSLFVAVNLLAGNTAVEPESRIGVGRWIQRHEEFVHRAKQGDVGLVFLGDSITDNWRKESPAGGKAIWDKKFAPLGAVNFGIGGDRTQNVLWRIENGELDEMHPELLVLMIGTNNIGFERDKVTPKNSVVETTDGVVAIVNAVRAKLPETKVLLLAIFPRGEKADDPERRQIAEINTAIARLHDGKTTFFLNLETQFLATDGTLSSAIMPDFVHPNEAGYKLWADALAAPLSNLLQKVASVP